MSVALLNRGHKADGVMGLERYMRLQAERKELEQEARRIKKEEDALACEICEYVEVCGPFRENGLRARFDSKPGRVAWKQEAEKELGPEWMKRKQAECPQKRVLIVEQATDIGEHGFPLKPGGNGNGHA